MTNVLLRQCRYFLTYSGVHLPLKLLNELEIAQIENRNTYFRGYFDSEERLTGVQKVVYGSVEMQHCYTYHDHGALKEAEITDADGEVTVLQFDEAGVLLD